MKGATCASYVREHRPFTAVTGVRIPLGTPTKTNSRLVMLLVYVLGFYEGSFFDRWLHRPITITPGHRSPDHMERVCRTRRERVIARDFRNDGPHSGQGPRRNWDAPFQLREPARRVRHVSPSRRTRVYKPRLISSCRSHCGSCLRSRNSHRSPHFPQTACLPSTSMWPPAVRRSRWASDSNSVCWHVALMFINMKFLLRCSVWKVTNSK